MMSCVSGSIFVICLVLASLNSCCNPWIYMCFNGNLLRQLICTRKSKERPVVACRPVRQDHRVPAHGGGGIGVGGGRQQLAPALQLQRQHHDQRPHSSLSLAKPTDMPDDGSQKEMFEMKVRTKESDLSCEPKATRTHFNANDYPCVLYRPLQPLDTNVIVKFQNSV